MINALFSGLNSLVGSGIDVGRFANLLPDPDVEIKAKRLKFLKEEAKEVRIAVFGKYNHGKSTLLNAVIGQDIFKTADKRETIKNAEHLHDDVKWIDTPGLDADVKGKDDEKAMEGAFKLADIILLVHSVESGELDKNEMQLYQRLIRNDSQYQSKLFLVLTKCEQLQEAVYQQVFNTIKLQLPDIILLPVSAQRYLKGIEEKKPVLVELSGMQALLDKVRHTKRKIVELRQVEIRDITQYLLAAITREKHHTELALQQAQGNVEQGDKHFRHALTEYQDHVNHIKSLHEYGSHAAVFDEIIDEMMEHILDHSAFEQKITENSQLKFRFEKAKTVQEKEKIVDELVILLEPCLKLTALEENKPLQAYFSKHDIPPIYWVDFQVMIKNGYLAKKLKSEFTTYMQ